MNEATNLARTGARVGTTWGIVVMILGILAIALPLLTGVALTMTLGVILFATGIAQVVYTFSSKSFGEGAARFVSKVDELLSQLVTLIR